MARRRSRCCPMRTSFSPIPTIPAFPTFPTIPAFSTISTCLSKAGCDPSAQDAVPFAFRTNDPSITTLRARQTQRYGRSSPGICWTGCFLRSFAAPGVSHCDNIGLGIGCRRHHGTVCGVGWFGPDDALKRSVNVIVKAIRISPRNITTGLHNP